MSRRHAGRRARAEHRPDRAGTPRVPRRAASRRTGDDDHRGVQRQDGERRTTFRGGEGERRRHPGHRPHPRGRDQLQGGERRRERRGFPVRARRAGSPSRDLLDLPVGAPRRDGADADRTLRRGSGLRRSPPDRTDQAGQQQEAGRESPELHAVPRPSGLSGPVPALPDGDAKGLLGRERPGATARPDALRRHRHERPQDLRTHGVPTVVRPRRRERPPDGLPDHRVRRRRENVDRGRTHLHERGREAGLAEEEAGSADRDRSRGLAGLRYRALRWGARGDRREADPDVDRLPEPDSPVERDGLLVAQRRGLRGGLRVLPGEGAAGARPGRRHQTSRRHRPGGRAPEAAGPPGEHQVQRRNHERRDLRRRDGHAVPRRRGHPRPTQEPDRRHPDRRPLHAALTRQDDRVRHRPGPASPGDRRRDQPGDGQAGRRVETARPDPDRPPGPRRPNRGPGTGS